MGQYSRMLEGEFTSTGVAKFVDLPVYPRYFEIVNKTQYNSTSQDDVKEAFSYQDEADGTAYITYNGAASSVANKTVITSGGFTWVNAGEPAFGAVKSASGADSVDKDSDFMVVNITSHGFQTGDVVWIYGTTGMLQIAGIPYTVTRVNANSFTIPIDTSEYTFAADATAVSAKLLKYADLYIPFLCYPTGIIAASAPNADHAIVTTNVDHRFEIGNRVKFRIPDEWGMVELDGLDGIVQDVGNIDNAGSYTAATSGAVNAFRVDIDVSGFTAFDYPTSAEAAAGMDFPQAIPVGDENFGYVYTGDDPLNKVLGAFDVNTRQGVIVGLGGTQVMHANNDVLHWKAELPDAYNP